MVCPADRRLQWKAGVYHCFLLLTLLYSSSYTCIFPKKYPLQATLTMFFTFKKSGPCSLDSIIGLSVYSVIGFHKLLVGPKASHYIYIYKFKTSWFCYLTLNSYLKWSICTFYYIIFSHEIPCELSFLLPVIQSLPNNSKPLWFLRNIKKIEIDTRCFRKFEEDGRTWHKGKAVTFDNGEWIFLPHVIYFHNDIMEQHKKGKGLKK